MANEKITKDMNIKDVIQKHPEVIPVFAKHNMGCIGCIAASYEKIADIAEVHGVDIEKFVKELNEAMKKK